MESRLNMTVDINSGASDMMEIMESGISELSKPERWENFHKLLGNLDKVAQSVKKTKHTSHRQERELQNKVIVVENRISRQKEKLDFLLKEIASVDEENSQQQEEINSAGDNINSFSMLSKQHSRKLGDYQRKYFECLGNISENQLKRVLEVKKMKESIENGSVLDNIRKGMDNSDKNRKLGNSENSQ